MAKDKDKAAAKQKAREEHIRRTSQNAKNSKSAQKAAEKKSNKGGKRGIFSRIKAYFAAVRTELRRVVWPSKKELINYSIAVIVTLLVVGVAIALLDAVIGEGLVLFAGLRG